MLGQTVGGPEKREGHMTSRFGRFLRRNTIALLALFVALSGTTFAAANVVLPKNSVGAKQLKKNAVTTPKIKKGAVTGAKIKLSTLGKVPSAASADSATHATSADSATHATSADSATHATSADSATNATTLQGFAAASLVRATTATAGTGTTPCGSGAIFPAFNTATFTSAVSKTVTAPVAGVLLVFGHVSFEFANAGPGTNVSLLGRLTVDGALKGQMAEGNSSNVTSSCNGGRTMSLDTAVAVAAGNHAVAYQIEKTGGDGNAYVGNASVTTLFVPFGNAGSQGVLGHTQVAGHSGASNH
jgi:hypothetical protein